MADVHGDADCLLGLLADGWSCDAQLRFWSADGEDYAVMPVPSACGCAKFPLADWLAGQGVSDAVERADLFRHRWDAGNWSGAVNLMTELGVCMQLTEMSLQLNMND
ncbi:hypothetical protein [Bifidobacterium eulemuris]|uniref:Uncharacterized protein n=1 Tax=Bifidobacterium eulemuris TaxID=1765219 RepID=A0A261G9Z4_9BIFI|nr:hypothetical protein [Bifidobacterium eulemuris]OZG68252.1 hypothetical protein BEUL_1265 [Bifidobacterium eulemuris]QOL31692.1 hypothetical protein BE0216_03865 [Bifidobacterium eulemuris]